MHKKLYRTRHDRKLGGICGGLGHYFHIDSSIVRLFMILLCIFTGILPLALAYLIACCIIPLEPSGYHPEPTRRLYRSSHDRKIAGICGGLSEVLKMDSSIIRILFLVICLITGIVPMVLIYLIAWVVIPDAHYIPK